MTPAGQLHSGELDIEPAIKKRALTVPARLPVRRLVNAYLATAYPDTIFIQNAHTSDRHRHPSYGSTRSSSPIPRQVVDYPTSEPAGSIIVNTGERRLYLALGA